MEFRVRHIVPADFPSLDADYIDRPDVLEWWCFQNPAGDGILAGAFADSRLAGLASLTPKPFVVRGASVMGAEIGNTITHPDFRGKGIFSRLVKHLVDVAREREYAIIFGTPNQASGHIYLGSLGFIGAFNVDRIGRPLDWNSLGARAGSLGEWVASIAGVVFDRVFPLKLGPFQYSASSSVEPDLEAFLARACQRCDCYIQRSASYVRWRLTRPDRAYTQVYLRDATGELCGWAAVQFVEHGDIKRARIGDWWVSPYTRSTVRALLSAVAVEGRLRGMDQIYAISRSMASKTMLKSLGFYRRRSKMPVIVRGVSGFDPRQLDGWEYRDSDSDMF